MTLRPLSLFLCLFLIAAGLLFPAVARADIMISPIYVIFEDRDRSAEVTIINVSTATNVYRLQWVYKRQKEDGSYEDLEGPVDPKYDPASFIRFSPRQVTLPPQGRQKIRLQLQKPADLPPGEYRLHLQFTRLPNMSDTADSLNPKGMQMRLRVFLGIAMPVIVRHGPYDANVDIVDAKFVKDREGNTSGKPELMVRVNRQGKQGTYGRLRVFLENGAEEKQVGALNNFAIYSERSDRVGYVQMNTDNIPSGSLRIVYEGDGPQRGKVLTERTIRVGQ